jgi:signal transduction histidine kinase
VRTVKHWALKAWAGARRWMRARRLLLWSQALIALCVAAAVVGVYLTFLTGLRAAFSENLRALEDDERKVAALLPIVAPRLYSYATAVPIGQLRHELDLTAAANLADQDLSTLFVERCAAGTCREPQDHSRVNFAAAFGPATREAPNLPRYLYLVAVVNETWLTRPRAGGTAQPPDELRVLLPAGSSTRRVVLTPVSVAAERTARLASGPRPLSTVAVTRWDDAFAVIGPLPSVEGTITRLANGSGSVLTAQIPLELLDITSSETLIGSRLAMGWLHRPGPSALPVLTSAGDVASGTADPPERAELDDAFRSLNLHSSLAVLLMPRRAQTYQLSTAPAPGAGARSPLRAAFDRWALAILSRQVPHRPELRLNDSTISLSLPVDGRESGLGLAIELDQPIAPVFDGAWRLARNLGAALLIAIATLGLLFYFGVLRISRRIRALSGRTRAALKLPAGSLAGASDFGRDELGYLAASIARLLRENAAERASLESQLLANEQLLRQLHAQLERNDQLVAAMISHEVRSPLRSLRAASAGNAGALRQIGRVEHAIEAIREGADSVSRRALHALDVAKFVRTLVDTWARLEGRPVRYEGPQQGLFALASEEHLEDLLGHVVANAEDFRDPPASLVRIRVESRGRDVTVCVFNCGPPIEGPALSRVFDLGFSTRRDDVEHLGQGLFKARQTVLSMNGSIHARNVPDPVGVEIEIVLPSATPVPAAASGN